MTRTRTLDEQALALFPPDGPHTPDTVRAATRAVAELVRYLNHATRTSQGFGEPSDLGHVLGDLEAAIERLPQLVRQLATVADRLADTPGIGSDRPGETGRECAGALSAELFEAHAPILAAGRAVEAAHQYASRLHMDQEG